MNQEVQSIPKLIQELEKLQHDMLESANFNYDVFEKRYQQIDKLELQQNKLADEAKYLNNEQVEKLYKDNGGTESTVCVSGIGGDAVGLEGVFNNFITNKSQQSQVVFVCENKHWLTVRLEKINGGIIYQVADSMPENPTKNKSNREERIDALLGDICTKIPFKSEKQQNGYDCGKFAATNASLMKKEFDAMRKNSEKEKASQPTILPQQKKIRYEGNIIDDIKNKLEQGNITIEQAIKSIEFIKGRVENTLHNAFEQENKSELQQKYIERLLKRIDDLGELHMKISQQKPQKSSRLSSASTVSFFSSNSNRSYSPQLKNSQLQRPRSASSPRSNISMTEPPLKTRQVSATPQLIVDKNLQELISR